MMIISFSFPFRISVRTWIQRILFAFYVRIDRFCHLKITILNNNYNLLSIFSSASYDTELTIEHKTPTEIRTRHAFSNNNVRYFISMYKLIHGNIRIRRKKIPNIIKRK